MRTQAECTHPVSLLDTYVQVCLDDLSCVHDTLAVELEAAAYTALDALIKQASELP